MDAPVSASKERGNVDAVSVHFSFDLRLGHDTKMTVAIGQCHAEAERCILQTPIVITLTTNGGPFLQKSRYSCKSFGCIETQSAATSLSDSFKCKMFEISQLYFS